MRKLLVIPFLLLLLISCKSKNDTHNVRYSVSGNAPSFDITYQNKDGGTSQVSGASSGWSYNFVGMNGDFVYVSAQNDADHGTVTVTIYVDGNVYKNSNSSGAYVIATADGTL